MQGELDIAGVIIFFGRNLHVEHAAQPSFMTMGGNFATFQQSDIPTVEDVSNWPIPKEPALIVVVLLKKPSYTMADSLLKDLDEREFLQE